MNLSAGVPARDRVGVIMEFDANTSDINNGSITQAGEDEVNATTTQE